jgi:hypothetical protein
MLCPFDKATNALCHGSIRALVKTWVICISICLSSPHIEAACTDSVDSTCDAVSVEVQQDVLFSDGFEAKPNYDFWPNPVSSANSDSWLARNHDQIKVMRPRVLICIQI